MKDRVVTHTLDNGLRIILSPGHHVPKVSTQLWYRVGSADEKTGERGLAHLLEHMTFKGTHKLSESDINSITALYAGYSNAFTSYDYTSYVYDFPSSCWTIALELLSDCMVNCTFKEDLLAAEKKAVIQELRMYQDSFETILLETMNAGIFSDHPYHYPIIGTRHDIWQVTHERLMNFYRTYYRPDNALLVIGGDFLVDEALETIEETFGHIANPASDLKVSHSVHRADVKQYGVTLYREVASSTVFLAWEVPGIRAQSGFVLDALSTLLAEDKGSLLYDLLVEKHQIATTVESFDYPLFDHGLFVIKFQPKDNNDIPTIIRYIQSCLETIIHEGIASFDSARTFNKAQLSYESTGESLHKKTYALAEFCLATGSPDYFLRYNDYTPEQLSRSLVDIIKTYLRPALMHTGTIHPLESADYPFWSDLIAKQEKYEDRFQAQNIRASQVEEPRFAQEIAVPQLPDYDYPPFEEITLANGMKILVMNNDVVDIVELVMKLDADQQRDPNDKSGLAHLVAQMLIEGTEKHPESALVKAFEERGISWSVSTQGIHMSLRPQDMVFALRLLHEMVTAATCSPEVFKRVKETVKADIALYWDEPTEFVVDLAKRVIYPHHPYEKSILGSLESVDACQHADLVNFYHQFYRPERSRLAIVGNILQQEDLVGHLESIFGQWKTGTPVPELTYPLVDYKPTTISYQITRDQVLLAFVAPSVSRLDNDYDPLLLFDIIFSGGPGALMSSRLFALREQSGLFYTISGSLLAHADKQPGMIFIATLVSPDDVEDARKQILEVIDHAIDSLTEEELFMARNIIVTTLADMFEANSSIAQTLLFLDTFDLSLEYIQKRADILQQLTVEQVSSVVKKYLRSDRMSKITIGNISKK